ncbi:response regulator [Silvibacterium dinghuense]|uniref:Response regulator n=1 Tax=Silvibacterium dinghuense TaxID=1560006 RepID=A0A4Q1SD73_9BACT|nr:response regulator [Silvibacterium dinghuense]RXS95179.1 response regulator [Silvibacterium dinghuense]GGH11337.1 hypothetical protein GCM10011586_29970 [Silvibacterium dinghuense]
MKTSRTVFVVDDESIIADTLAVILSQSGFAAQSFHRFQDVLSAAELIVPDLLISDVAMPGMTGIDLGKYIRAKYPACRVLLFSGKATMRDMLKRAQQEGDFEILEKPIHPADLLEKVKGSCSV